MATSGDPYGGDPHLSARAPWDEVAGPPHNVINELLEVLLPRIIELDEAYVDACALENWLEASRARSLKDYPSLRWYALLAEQPSGAREYRDPVVNVAQRWLDEIAQVQKRKLVLRVRTPDNEFGDQQERLGDAAMAGQLKRWLRQAFAHNPSKLILEKDHSGDVHARIYFNDTRRCARKKFKMSRRPTSEKSTHVLAGYFLATEADDLCDRLDYLDTKYDYSSRRSVVKAIYSTADECRQAADILIRSEDPVSDLMRKDIEPSQPNPSVAGSASHEGNDEAMSILYHCWKEA